MGADSTLVFYGVRFAVAPVESETLETRRDSRVLLARKFGLDHWWGDFATAAGEREQFLFVGAKLSQIGYEGEFEKRICRSRLTELMDQIEDKLSCAGLDGEPELHVQFQPD